MEKLVTEYVIATPDQVSTGKFPENTLRTTDLQEAKWMFPENTDTFPEIFILAGYRRALIKGDVPGTDRLADISQIPDRFKGLFKQETASLTQIGYDSKKTTAECIEKSMAPFEDRIKIVPYDDLQTPGNELNYHKKLKFIVDTAGINELDTIKGPEAAGFKVAKALYQNRDEVKGFLTDLKSRQGLTLDESLIYLFLEQLEYYTGKYGPEILRGER